MGCVVIVRGRIVEGPVDRLVTSRSWSFYPRLSLPDSPLTTCSVRKSVWNPRGSSVALQRYI